MYKRSLEEEIEKIKRKIKRKKKKLETRSIIRMKYKLNLILEHIYVYVCVKHY